MDTKTCNLSHLKKLEKTLEQEIVPVSYLKIKSPLSDEGFNFYHCFCALFPARVVVGT